MKLQKNNKYQKCVALCLAYISTLMLNNITEEELPREEIVTPTIEFCETPRILSNFVVPTEEEIIENIFDLNIIQKENPSNVYKVLQFKDNKGYYRIMAVITKVCYIIDEEGNIIDDYYEVYDAFSNEKLFTTTTFESDITSFNILFEGVEIISYDNLSKLGDIAYLYGATDEYIENILPDLREHEFLGNVDVARMYISLVPSNYRVSYSELDKDKTLSIG